MAHASYTIDEIKARVYANGTKGSKIKFLTDECGYTKAEAENTYRLLMLVCDAPVTHTATGALRFTVGVELECTNVNRDRVRSICAERGIQSYDSYSHYNHNDSHTAYKLMSDSSLGSSRGDIYSPCEIVTPVLHNLNSLKTVCEVLKEAGAGVNKSCGLHVHFGAANFTDAEWRRIVINYSNLEDVIDTFMPLSRRNSEWCRSMRYCIDEVKADENMSRIDMRRVYRCDRYHKVNLEAFDRHSTIEFRQHAGTIEFTKIENWVKFLAALLTWSIQHTETIEGRTAIDEIPFLNAKQKAYFNGRAREIAARLARA